MPNLQLRLRARILGVQFSNAFLRLRLKPLHFRFTRLLARHPNSTLTDTASESIQVLLLNCDIHHPTPLGTKLLSIAPTFEAISQILGGKVAPFDAGFMDVIGFSHDLAFATWSPPKPIYPCGSEVFRLGPVLFAGIQDDIADIQAGRGDAPTMNDDTPHSLGTLSALSFQELLDFYLPQMEIADRLAATRAFSAGEEWNWGELPKVAEPYVPSYAREPRIVKHRPVPLPKPQDNDALFSNEPLRVLCLKFEALPEFTGAVRLTVEFRHIAHSYAAIEELFSGPVVGFQTPFDTVVALCADPKSVEGRKALFELRFTDDIARFPELLPLVGFVCGSPLLEPEINASRFYDIEPDQIEQIVEVFAWHLTQNARQLAIEGLELGSAWSADIFAG